MKCPQCNLNATIANAEHKSDIGSTDVFVEQTYVCTNSKCGMYAGKDLSNPATIIEATRTKIN
jgi:hypothetical protein